MSRFLSMAATMQTLSLAAMEEASREGRREADIEHLLMALTLNEQIAGQVLRRKGVTLEAVRTAVAAQHAQQLSSLGVTTDAEQPGRIVFHETSGYAWNDRALRVLNLAGDGGASDVLRGLVIEPSGMIAEILEQLGTSADAVTAELDALEHLPRHARAGRTPRTSFETFIPASIADVWALVSDAERMPDWEPMIDSVSPRDDDGWDARARTVRDDGRPISVKPPFLARRIERLEALEPTRVTWRFTFPDAPGSNAQSLTLDLAPAAGGTQLTLTSSWTTRAGWRGMIGRMLRPLQRLLNWMRLLQTGSAISRVFR
ncbi:SRPBCC family protein [Microbacterium sp. CIAB417]|uniref:SRPBCC family protein n=1 Tax=Microbacterium sp. CIAB417 TaxID=2860287 RepID=UPI001FABA688|nr:SRPBCC family protein [Microbacterium sp. CIAB417]